MGMSNSDFLPKIARRRGMAPTIAAAVGIAGVIGREQAHTLRDVFAPLPHSTRIPATRVIKTRPLTPTQYSKSAERVTSV